MMNKVDKVFESATGIINNKQSRSFIFLILTIVAIFALNSLLPLLEGNAHYTCDAVEMTYSQYKQMHTINDDYRLTYKSDLDIEVYKNKYKSEHPEITVDDEYRIEPPDFFKVNVYTKFFFQSITWYTSTLIQVISVIAIYIALFNFLLTRHKLKYKKYVDLDNEVTTLTNTSLDPVTFEPYMEDVFNRERKIKQHKANINYKLERLEKRTNYKVRNELRLRSQGKQTQQKRSIERKIRIYLNRFNNLKDQLTEDYINRYVVDGKVTNFKYIHPLFVMCGVNNIGKTTDTFSLVNSDAGRFSKDITHKVMLSVIFTIVLSVLLTITVVTSKNQSVLWIIINVITKIVPLTLQIPLAYDYRDTFMDTQLISNLMLRRNIAYLYLAYINGNKPVDTQNNFELLKDKPLEVIDANKD